MRTKLSIHAGLRTEGVVKYSSGDIFAAWGGRKDRKDRKVGKTERRKDGKLERPNLILIFAHENRNLQRQRHQ